MISLLTIIFAFPGISYTKLLPGEEDKTLEICLEKITNELLSRNAAWTLVYNSKNIREFPLTQLNKLVQVLDLNEEVRHQITNSTIYNYIMMINGTHNIEENMEIIKNTTFWNKSFSPRGNMLIVSVVDVDAASIFSYMWKQNVMKVVLIHLYETYYQVHVSSPYYINSKCGQKVFLISPGTCMEAYVSFPNIPTKLNCDFLAGGLHIMNGLPFVGDLDANQHIGLFVYPMKLIGEVLGLNITFRNVDSELQSNFIRLGSPELRRQVYNGEEDVILAYVNRYVYQTANNDMSDIFLYDDPIWVIAKPEKLSNFKVLSSVFTPTLWLCLVIMIFLASSIWWVMSSVYSKATLQNFVQSLLQVYQMTINIGLVSKFSSSYLRILMFSYFLYSMHVTSYFQGRLGSILTQPGTERGVTSVEELSLSKTVKPMTFLHHWRRIAGFQEQTAQRLTRNIVQLNSAKFLEIFQYTAKYKNVSTTTYKSILNYYPDFIDAFNVIGNDYLLGFEATFCLRQGHPFLGRINAIISRINEAGFQKKWLSEMAKRHFIPSANQDVTLSLEHLHAAFLILILGHSISLMLMASEFGLSKINSRNNVSYSKQLPPNIVNPQLEDQPLTGLLPPETKSLYE